MAFPGQVRQVADQPQARDEGRPTLYLVRQVRDRLAISGSNIREDLQASQPYLMLVKSRKVIAAISSSHMAWKLQSVVHELSSGQCSYSVSY